MRPKRCNLSLSFDFKLKEYLLIGIVVAVPHLYAYGPKGFNPVMIRFVLLVGLLVCATASSQAQIVENINASFDGEKMVITYDLRFTDANQKFKIVLYSSQDNYSEPLLLVTGDTGENVLPGKVKRVVWDAKSVLPEYFDGDIRIKIKASKIAPPKLVFEPLALKTYKRGRTISMKWTGGYSTDQVIIELYKEKAFNLLVADKMNNTATYEWKMPKSVKGRNYTLRITNAARPDEQAESQAFRVKPSVPLLVKILPILAAGGIIALSSGPHPPQPDGTLPGPVNP